MDQMMRVLFCWSVWRTPLAIVDIVEVWRPRFDTVVQTVTCTVYFLGCFLILGFLNRISWRSLRQSWNSFVYAIIDGVWFTMQRSIVCNMTVQYTNKNNEEYIVVHQCKLKNPEVVFLSWWPVFYIDMREKRTKKLSTMYPKLYFCCIFHKQNRKAEVASKKVAWPFISISYVFRGGDMIPAANANSVWYKVLFTNRNT